MKFALRFQPIEVLRVALFQDSRGIAADNGKIRDIFCCHGTSTNYSALSNGNAGDNCHIAATPDKISSDNWLEWHSVVVRYGTGIVVCMVARKDSETSPNRM